MGIFDDQVNWLKSLIAENEQQLKDFESGLSIHERKEGENDFTDVTGGWIERLKSNNARFQQLIDAYQKHQDR